MSRPGDAAYLYVQEREAVETVIQHIHAAKQVALDTEADSLHNYFEKVCLIQLSLDGDHYLVDPLAQLDLSGLLAALADKPLVLHGADYDLRMLRASTGFRPRREVFDTMVAAQLLGLEQLGLAALIERYFEVSIGKAGQKSDWSRRPLREQQLSYAVNDTRFLEALAEQLRAELGARGRIEWHRQSCQAMVESTGRDRSRDPANGWRINGAGRLTRRQLAYLRELWCWRDEQARAADLPAFKIFGNEPLFELLQWAESHPEVPLHQGPKLPRNIRGARLQRLEEALARAASLKPAEWPQQRILKRNDGVPADGRERFVALRGECARIAADLGIAASTLAPRAALEAIARGHLRGLDEITKSAGLLRWQAELVQGAVDQVENASKN